MPSLLLIPFEVEVDELVIAIDGEMKVVTVVFEDPSILSDQKKTENALCKQPIYTKLWKYFIGVSSFSDQPNGLKDQDLRTFSCQIILHVKKYMPIFFLPREAGISDMLVQSLRFMAIGHYFGYKIKILDFPHGRVSQSLNLSNLLIGNRNSHCVPQNAVELSVTEFGQMALNKNTAILNRDYIIKSHTGLDVTSLYISLGIGIDQNSRDELAILLRGGQLYKLYLQKNVLRNPDKRLISLHLRFGDTAVISGKAVEWNHSLRELFNNREFFTYDSCFYTREALREHLLSRSFLNRFAEAPTSKDYLEALNHFQISSGNLENYNSFAGDKIIINSDGCSLASERIIAVAMRDSLSDFPSKEILKDSLDRYYMGSLIDIGDSCNIGESDDLLVESILNCLLADVVFKGVSQFPLCLRECMGIIAPLVINVKHGGISELTNHEFVDLM